MYTINWDGDDLWNVLNLPNTELYRLYAPLYNGSKRDRQANIRSRANKHRRLLKAGKITMPERSIPYDPDKEPERIESRRQKAAMHLASTALETTVINIPTEHLPYHEKLQEALQSEGRLEGMTFRSGEHEGYIKNSEGEIEYTRPLKAERTIFSVKFDHEPKWPPVTRVESIKLPRKEKPEKDSLRASRKAVILPDLQIPYHDENAVSVALEVLRDVKPDKIVLLGDLLDLSAWSKYEQRPEWAQATQAAVIQAHEILVKLRKICPNAEITVLEGNHDKRMERGLLNNARMAYGLRKANALDGWPVMSVPYLTAMDDLGIDYLAGYPANRYWINENLQVRHGHKVRSAGSTAKLVSDDERTSTIFGHVHRIETQYKTSHTYSGGKTNAAYSIGCLCKIDGSVPSVKNGYDLSGKPVTNFEDWQQAFAIVEYEEGDSPFNVTPIYINTFNGYRTIYNGKKYEV